MDTPKLTSLQRLPYLVLWGAATIALAPLASVLVDLNFDKHSNPTEYKLATFCGLVGSVVFGYIGAHFYFIVSKLQRIIQRRHG